MIKPLVLTLLCTAWLPLSAQAASFGCLDVDTEVESAICADPDLNRMDEDLAGQYQDLLRELSPREARKLRQEQRSWLRARDSCGDDVRCLRARYEERSARLDQY
jgi:uncharacterized protein